MSTRTHTKQIQSVSGQFQHLYEEVDAIIRDDIENLTDVDINFDYDTAGNPTTETVSDLSDNVIRKIETTYNADGTLNTETVTKGGKVLVKTYIYRTDGLLSQVQVRKAVI